MSSRDDPNVQKCDCGKVFLTEHGYKIHKQRVHEDENKCAKEHSEFPDPELLHERFDEALVVVSGKYSGKKLHIPVSDDVDGTLCSRDRTYARKPTAVFTPDTEWCEGCMSHVDSEGRVEVESETELEYQCSFCDDCFETYLGKRNHEGLMHLPLKEEVECGFCETVFTAYRRENRVYCSRECHGASKRVEFESKICEHCGKDYGREKPQNTRFCSRECYRDHEEQIDSELKDKILNLYDEQEISVRKTSKQTGVPRERLIEFLKDEGVYRERLCTKLKKMTVEAQHG